MTVEAKNWEAAGAAKRAAAAQLIPSELRIKAPPADVLDVRSVPRTCGLLSETELAITESASVVALLGKIHSGAYSAVQVVTAFSKRALIAQQLTNCLTEIFVDAALERAKALDDHFAKTGKPVGPLQLPISLKEQIAIKDVEMSFGYVGWLGRVSDRDAALTEILVKQGAVPYVRTNIPQGLWFGEANNNVFGFTTNPANRNLTCGGSSGGEGALNAMRGSILGVGSDIGGSVRIPAAFNGLYGLRPSWGRIPYCGSVNSAEGQSAVPSVLGPLTPVVDGLKVFTKAVVDGRPWDVDPLAPRMPWSEAAYDLAEHGGVGAKLCFAVMWDDGVVLPAGPYKRALDETKAALVAAGHEVIDWVPFKPLEGAEIIGDIFNADGGEDLETQMALSGEPNLGLVLDPNAKAKSAYEFWQISHRKNVYAKEALDHWMATVARTSTGRPVDAIIAPGSCTPPPPHKSPVYIYYTSWCNVTDYAVGVVPVTAVDPAVDAKPARETFMSEWDKKNYDLYDAEYMKGAPISIQVVGGKLEEEAVIRMTEIVDAAIKQGRK